MLDDGPGVNPGPPAFTSVRNIILHNMPVFGIIDYWFGCAVPDDVVFDNPCPAALA